MAQAELENLPIITHDPAFQTGLIQVIPPVDEEGQESRWGINPQFTMNEAETRAELIDPALKASGWGIVEGSSSYLVSTIHYDSSFSAKVRPQRKRYNLP